MTHKNSSIFLTLLTIFGLLSVTAFGNVIFRGGNGHGFFLGNPNFTQPNLPIVLLATPDNGGPEGGTNFNIYGQYFTGATSVKIGGTTLTSGQFTIVSDTVINIPSSPASTVSPVDIQVTNTIGQSTLNTSGCPSDPTTGPPLNNCDQFIYQAVMQTFAAGTVDALSIKMGGTEWREATVHIVPKNGFLQKLVGGGYAICNINGGCPTIFAGMGFWGDSNCSDNQLGTNQGPQVNILTSSLGKWTNDLNITDSCSGFEVTNSLINHKFYYYGDGTSTGPNGLDVVAMGDANSNVRGRNDVDGSWPSINPDGLGSVRGEAGHIDSSQSTSTPKCADGLCRDYLLNGGDVTGISSITLNSGTFGFTLVHGLGTCVGSIANCGSNGNNCSGNSCKGEPFSQDGVTPGTCQSTNLCTNLSSQWSGLNFLGIGSSTTYFNANINGTTLTLTGNSIGNGFALGLVLAGPGISGTPTLVSLLSGTLGNSGSTYSISTNQGTISTEQMWLIGCSPRTVQGCMGNLRVLAVTECPVTSGGNFQGNAVFAAIGWQVWRRVDNAANSYWILWDEATDTEVEYYTNQNGLRGLACIPNGSGGYALLAMAQVQGDMVRFDPNTQMSGGVPGAVVETNVSNCLEPGLWPGSGGSRITAYNGADMFQINNSIIIGEGNITPTPDTGIHARASYGGSSGGYDGISGFWMRPLTGPTGGTCGGYTLYPPDPGTTATPAPVLVAIKPADCGTSGGCNNTYNGNPNPATRNAWACTVDSHGYCSIMGSDRDIQCSPFYEDGATAANGWCGRVLFYGGRDDEAPNPVHNVAWAVRVPITSIASPTSGSAYIP